MNQAANQIAHANHLSKFDTNRLLAVLNIAMAEAAFTTLSSKRFYGGVPNEVTWRPVTSIPLADTDGNPDTARDPGWLPPINTQLRPFSSANSNAFTLTMMDSPQVHRHRAGALGR